MFILQQAIVGTIGAVFLVAAYFLPWIIASRRDHHQVGAIAAVNILLGWTFLGWVVAFIWSLTYTPPTSGQA